MSSVKEKLFIEALEIIKLDKGNFYQNSLTE